MATLVLLLGLERLITANVELSGRVGGVLPGRKVSRATTEIVSRRHATAKIGPDRWSHPRIRTGCVRRSHEVLGTSTAERSAAMSSSAMAFTSVVDQVQGPTSELLYCHTDNTGLPHR